MKYGVNTLLWTAAFERKHFDLLPRIREWGFDGVEIAGFSFDGFPAAGIRARLEAEKLEATMCTALTGKTSLVDPETHAEARDFLKSAIRAAGEIGARILCGPVCAPVGLLPGRRRTGGEWELAIKGLQELIPTLEDADVTLAVEPLNRFETYFLNTAADASALCDAVGHSRVGVLFDTFHANIEEKTITSACARLGPHLNHVHTCENDRGTPGTGHVQWRELFQSLRALNYDSWLVIESFGFAIKEIAAAASIWRDLAASVDEIASDGLRFLLEQTPAPRQPG